MKTWHILLLLVVGGLLWIAVRKLREIQLSVAHVGGQVAGMAINLSALQRQLEQTKNEGKES